MDFSPHKNATEYDRGIFGTDDESMTHKSSAQPQIIQKPKPEQIEKASPADPNHAAAGTIVSPTPRNSETPAANTNNTQAVSDVSQDSSGSTRSNSLESSSTAGSVKRHTGGDSRWEAIQQAAARDAPLNLGHFRLLKRLGYGDIGSVYLVELRGTSAFFAMKVMDKASLVSRNKLARAETERQILGLLDHPFLPTLYTHFETDKFYCLVMEYCSGGNLHSLRQKQPSKHFSEQAARFYTAEILLALEYLHLLGIVYRDLKPENVLVRDDGHIMLSDFDLSLRCSVCPTLVKSSPAPPPALNVGLCGAGGRGGEAPDGDCVLANPGCMQPSSFFPRILPRRSRRSSKSDMAQIAAAGVEFNAEPTDARSMSFVGTHEYLAPEIIRGEGHGSAVDWWTLGIFLYELLHGTTPFKGQGNRATLCNVIEQPLRFPAAASAVARDLVRGLLVKDPQKRIAFTRGATEIKQHPFFEGVNWALVRTMAPPSVPDPVDFRQYAAAAAKEKSAAAAPAGSSTSESPSDFEYF